MIEYKQLFDMAQHAEDVTGHSTPEANRNEYGFWKRIVDAVETRAGNTDANERWEGWLIQLARAALTLADREDEILNHTDMGYWKVIAQCFAYLTGGSYPGDWPHKAYLAFMDWPGGPNPPVGQLMLERGGFFLFEDGLRIGLED